MRTTLVIVVASCLLFLTACTTGKGRGLELKPAILPEWAKTGVHPDYPESEWLVAYGLARTGKEADEAAVSRLEAMICDEAIRPNNGLFKDTSFAQIVTRPAGWFTLDEFTDAVRVDTASSGFETVSLRAIKRNELGLRARALLPQVNKALAETDQPPAGLGSIPKRLEMWGNFYLLAIRVVALELLATSTLNRNAFDKVEDALLSLWELPALIKTDLGGNDQHVRIHGGTPERITMRAWFRNQPVAGVPILWGPGAGFKGVLEGDKELDATGLAGAEVHYLSPTGDDFGYAQASIDLDRVVGRRTGVAMNVWLWRVLLPSRETGQLVVRISEFKGEEPLAEPVFVPEAKIWSEGRGLAFSEAEPDAARYHYHLLLEGKLEVLAYTRDEIPGAYVTGTLTLSDLDSANELYSYTVGLHRQGAKGNTEQGVLLLALREAAGEVLAEFASRIVAALPAPGDEFGR